MKKKIRSIEFSKCRTKYGGFKIPELDIDNFSPAKVTEEISVENIDDRFGSTVQLNCA